MRGIFHFFLAAALYFLCTVYAGDFLVFPSPLTRCAVFLSPILCLMWGPVAAVGVALGEILSEYGMWLPLVRLWHEDGVFMGFGQILPPLCSRGLWAFFCAYLPYRLWHSLRSSEEPRFYLRTGTLLKFVLIMFLSAVMTSLFLALSTAEADIISRLGNATLRFGWVGEFAFLNFINTFNISLFFGLIGFLILISCNYPFHQPGKSLWSSKWNRAFDLLFLLSCAAALFLCIPRADPYGDLKLPICILLALYALRPITPMEEEAEDPDERADTGYFPTSRRIAALFYAIFLLLFLLLDVSGTIYGLSRVDTWRQFCGECLTMMNAGLVALLYMLLRYRQSIMTSVVLLEVVAVFISAFALGVVCFVVTDRITTRHLESSLEEMSVICRERIKRTFDGIQVSVNDIRDLALDELESYGRLREDAAYRQEYLARTEYLFRSIASNTAGSIAFYLRCDPAFSGGLGGFSWGRETSRWTGGESSFQRRTPIDLSKYQPSDMENVGWYYIPVERHQPTWIEPYVDPTAESYVVSYVSPLYADKNLVGVVGMDIDFDYLIHEVQRMSVYKYGHVYLLNRSGKVLYHKNFPQGATFRPNPAFHEKETYLTNGIWMGIAVPMSEVYAERNNLLMHFTGVMLFVAILISLSSIGLAAKGIRPLLALTEAARKIAAGDLEVKMPGESDNELGTLVRSMGEMVSKLEGYVYRDKLTGLWNTAAYMRKCEELSRAQGEKDFRYAVLVFDVNFLKKTNDKYGHEAGNDLICSAAQVISDAFPHSPVFRIGGDEFTAILQELDYDRRRELLAEFDEAISEREISLQDGTHIPVSVARGMGIYQKGMEYADVFHEADEAMYAHKSAIKKQMGEAPRSSPRTK